MLDISNHLSSMKTVKECSFDRVAVSTKNGIAKRWGKVVGLAIRRAEASINESPPNLIFIFRINLNISNPDRYSKTGDGFRNEILKFQLRGYVEHSFLSTE